MAVKSLVLSCDWCHTTAEVEFDHAEDEFLLTSDDYPLPDEDWFHLEGEGQEKDFCSKDCIRSHLA